MELPILTVALADHQDVVLARQRARETARLLGLDSSGQTRFAASVSEIARNAIAHAGGGRVVFAVSRQDTPCLIARISDYGPGFADLDAVLEGRTQGRGISDARRLVDALDITTGPAGTTVVLSRGLSEVVTSAKIAQVVARLGDSLSVNPMVEVQRQNSELITSLAELRGRQDELQRLNTELEDTNRGVVALYAELDERAEQLRQASELKSRFLSNMSHEFRTPLNSILALSRLLMDHADGPLTPEQERQVGYIRRSAESLAEMVDDLLDLAKVEAGKLDVRAGLFSIAELFGALRGVMKPLLVNDAVDLVFEDPPLGHPLFTDEAKVAQILRNLISNALKFTERGVVRVSARFDQQARNVSLVVADTGIGIASAHREMVFQEFAQVANSLQGRTKGTGLGLPLSRRLAELLGGTLTVDSAVGVGSTFTLQIPRTLGQPVPAVVPEPGNARNVLLIDDEETSRYVVRQMSAGAIGVSWREAATAAEGLRMVHEHRPDLIILDLRLPDMSGFEVFARLRADRQTADIPIIICTASAVSASDRSRLASARTILSKASLTREMMQRVLNDAWLDSVTELTGAAATGRTKGLR